MYAKAHPNLPVDTTYECFRKNFKQKLDGIDTVRFASDAYGGQNKNSALIYMASYWLITHAPVSVKQIELLFSVRGHTFLPCDRVFGTPEKKLRKNGKNLLPRRVL